MRNHKRLMTSALTLLLVGVMSSVASASITFDFTFENDGDLTNGLFGTVTVSDDVDDQLTFTVDIFEEIFGSPTTTPDIQSFGFQIAAPFASAGAVSLVPGDDALGLTHNDTVQGMGNNPFHWVADFGSGASTIVDPAVFTISAAGLDINALLSAPTMETNTGNTAHFGAHIQSTHPDPPGSESIGGLYEDSGRNNPLIPEPMSLLIWGAMAGLFAVPAARRRRAG